jgi:hypothetical protein
MRAIDLDWSEGNEAGNGLLKSEWLRRAFTERLDHSNSVIVPRGLGGSEVLETSVELSLSRAATVCFTGTLDVRFVVSHMASQVI